MHSSPILSISTSKLSPRSSSNSDTSTSSRSVSIKSTHVVKLLAILQTRSVETSVSMPCVNILCDWRWRYCVTARRHTPRTCWYCCGISVRARLSCSATQRKRSCGAEVITAPVWKSRRRGWDGWFGNIDPNVPPSLAAMFDTHSLMSVSTVSGRREKKSDFFCFFWKVSTDLKEKRKWLRSQQWVRIKRRGNAFYVPL